MFNSPHEEADFWADSPTAYKADQTWTAKFKKWRAEQPRLGYNDSADYKEHLRKTKQASVSTYREHKRKLKKGRSVNINAGGILTGVAKIIKPLLMFALVFLVVAYFMIGPDKAKAWLNNIMSALFGQGSGTGTQEGFTEAEGDAGHTALASSLALRVQSAFTSVNGTGSIQQVYDDMIGLSDGEIRSVYNAFEKKPFYYVIPWGSEDLDMVAFVNKYYQTHYGFLKDEFAALFHRAGLA
jgi:hypothetical protein